MSDDGSGDEAGAGDSLRRLDASLDVAGRGDYKRVLLLRFLHDQARISQRLDERAPRADEERGCCSSDDGVGGGGGGDGGGALAAVLRDLDVEDAHSLNALQLHQRRLRLGSGGGGGGGGYAAEDDTSAADAPWSRQSAPAPSSSVAVRPRSSAATSGRELRRTRGTVEFERPAEGVARVTTLGRGGGGGEARDGRQVSHPNHRISLDSRPQGWRQFDCDGGVPYGGGRRSYADASVTAASAASAPLSPAAGAAASYAAYARTTVAGGGTSIVKLPALFKQPGVGKFDFGGIRYAGVNNA